MNNEVLIPKNWRDQVVSILKTEDKSRILFTLDCRNRWQARFPSASHYQLYDALIEALSDDDITGIEIFDMDEGYETWKFFFMQENVKLYGKVGLHPNRIVIKIYSAHPPFKGDKL